MTKSGRMATIFGGDLDFGRCWRKPLGLNLLNLPPAKQEEILFLEGGKGRVGAVISTELGLPSEDR